MRFLKRIRIASLARFMAASAWLALFVSGYPGAPARGEPESLSRCSTQGGVRILALVIGLCEFAANLNEALDIASVIWRWS